MRHIQHRFVEIAATAALLAVCGATAAQTNTGADRNGTVPSGDAGYGKSERTSGSVGSAPANVDNAIPGPGWAHQQANNPDATTAAPADQGATSTSTSGTGSASGSGTNASDTGSVAPGSDMNSNSSATSSSADMTQSSGTGRSARAARADRN